MPDIKNDMERYLQGKMTPQERHALEKKALSDPFLADAIEGAENINSDLFGSDVAGLQDKILKRQRSGNRTAWRIAASIGLLIGAGVTLYLLIKPADEFIAQQTTPVKIPKEIDSKEQTPVSKEGKSETKSSAVQPIAGLPKTEPPAAVEAHENKPVTKALQPAPTSGNLDMAKEETEKTETPTIASTQGAGAVKDKVIMAKEDVQRDESALKSAPASLAEESPVKKMRASRTASTDDQLPGGQEAYSKYLESNLRYPQKAITEKTEGTVVIEFHIDPSGVLSEFNVIKSLGNGCDEEAIRLVKEGPAWPGAASTRMEKVSVKFTLPK
jgi:TonB family protein